MKTLLVLSALTATSAIYALPATASCTDPRTAQPLSGMTRLLAAAAGNHDIGSHRSMVGTWLVTYTFGGAPGGEAFIQWHSDGTEWENINHPILGGNICMGSWKVLDARHVARNHFGWLYDGGLLSGFFNETETDELSRDGNSYSGTNELKMYDLSGNMTADLTGTDSATRLAP
jgi:hypothetical protein